MSCHVPRIRCNLPAVLAACLLLTGVAGAVGSSRVEERLELRKATVEAEAFAHLAACEQEVELLPFDGSTLDFFGWTVAADGGTAIVGAPDDDVGASFEAGSAYTFTRGAGWTGEDHLLHPAPETGDSYGWSVAIDGDTALVGVNGDDEKGTQAGAVFVLTRSGSSWSVQQKLLASDGVAGDFFGQSVALLGDTALVGSLAEAAYVFERTGGVWTEIAKLTAADGFPNQDFGWSVGLTADWAVVGAPRDDDQGLASGAAYVFERPGWTQDAKLTATDGLTGDRFGESVAVDGDTVLAGAYRHGDAGPEAGAAYVFEHSGTWSQQAKLLPTGSILASWFGRSVALEGDLALVGAPQDSNAVFFAGAAYLFERSGSSWSLHERITASDPQPFSGFGRSVALDGTRVVIGVPEDTGAGTGSGSAYVFECGANEPPVAGCRDVVIAADASCAAAATVGDLDDGSFDPDGPGDIADLCITEVDGSPVGCDGSAVFTDDLGTHTVVLTITDQAGVSDSCEATVRVVDDTAPTPRCPPDASLPADGSCEATYTGPPATASDNCDPSPEVSATPSLPATFQGLGTSSIVWIAEDASGNAARCGHQVRVVDNTPPFLVEVAPLLSCFWPPNHKMRTVTLGEEVEIEAADNCDPDPEVAFTSCISDEEDDGLGDGHTIGDCVVTSPTTVNARAERSGRGDGRAYAVSFSMTDDDGNAAGDVFAITVEHDQREEGCSVTCVPNPDCVCPTFYDPVTCDQGTFSNACFASCVCATNCEPAS